MGEFFSMLAPGTAYESIRAFLDQGGPVLLFIMVATFLMWALIAERYMYFSFAHKAIADIAGEAWEARSEHRSWTAHAIREKLISEVRQHAQANIQMIKTLVAIAPLLGLLGTVTGMVQVFDVMAISGSSNARGMAEGVSRATIPTMAGMVASLSGIFFSAELERKANRAVQETADHLTIY